RPTCGVVAEEQEEDAKISKNFKDGDLNSKDVSSNVAVGENDPECTPTDGQAAEEKPSPGRESLTSLPDKLYSQEKLAINVAVTPNLTEEKPSEQAIPPATSVMTRRI